MVCQGAPGGAAQDEWAGARRHAGGFAAKPRPETTRRRSTNGSTNALEPVGMEGA